MLVARPVYRASFNMLDSIFDQRLSRGFLSLGVAAIVLPACLGQVDERAHQNEPVSTAGEAGASGGDAAGSSGASGRETALRACDLGCPQEPPLADASCRHSEGLSCRYAPGGDCSSTTSVKTASCRATYTYGIAWEYGEHPVCTHDGEPVIDDHYSFCISLQDAQSICPATREAMAATHSCGSGIQTGTCSGVDDIAYSAGYYAFDCFYDSTTGQLSGVMYNNESAVTMYAGASWTCELSVCENPL